MYAIILCPIIDEHAKVMVQNDNMYTPIIHLISGLGCKSPYPTVNIVDVVKYNESTIDHPSNKLTIVTPINIIAKIESDAMMNSCKARFLDIHLPLP